MEISEILPFIAGIASFLVAGGLVAWISKQPAGTKEMMDISNAVKVGAAAFLKREMKIIVPVAIALTVIIGAFLTPSNGLAFAVNKGNKIPSSLKNIYKEIQDDIGDCIHSSGNLEQWAAQGVVLLNSSLTVNKSEAGSHKNIGWHILIDSVIEL